MLYIYSDYTFPITGIFHRTMMMGETEFLDSEVSHDKDVAMYVL